MADEADANVDDQQNYIQTSSSYVVLFCSFVVCTFVHSSSRR